MLGHHGRPRHLQCVERGVHGLDEIVGFASHDVGEPPEVISLEPFEHALAGSLLDLPLRPDQLIELVPPGLRPATRRPPL